MAVVTMSERLEVATVIEKNAREKLVLLRELVDAFEELHCKAKADKARLESAVYGPNWTY